MGMKNSLDIFADGFWTEFISSAIDMNFLEQIFTSGIILNETAKTKSVKIY